MNNTLNLCPLTLPIPCYTHKMAIVYRDHWPLIMWRHFTLCIQGGPKKWGHRLDIMTPILSNLNRSVLFFSRPHKAPRWVIEPSRWLLLDRAESVTENRNRYRDILKNRNRHRRRHWKNRKKRKPTKKIPKKPENSVFADDDLLISSIFIFAVNVKKWICETPLPPGTVTAAVYCTRKLS